LGVSSLNGDGCTSHLTQWGGVLVVELSGSWVAKTRVGIPPPSAVGLTCDNTGDGLHVGGECGSAVSALGVESTDFRVRESTTPDSCGSNPTVDVMTARSWVLVSRVGTELGVGVSSSTLVSDDVTLNSIQVGGGGTSSSPDSDNVDPLSDGWSWKAGFVGLTSTNGNTAESVIVKDKTPVVSTVVV